MQTLANARVLWLGRFIGHMRGIVGDHKPLNAGFASVTKNLSGQKSTNPKAFPAEFASETKILPDQEFTNPKRLPAGFASVTKNLPDQEIEKLMTGPDRLFAHNVLPLAVIKLTEYVRSDSFIHH